jgi:hypothetical protein
MLFPEVSRAASPEGIIALAVVYFIFAAFSKLKKSAEKNNRPRLPQDPPVAGSEAGRAGAAAPGAFSLQAVLREIERVKQEADRRPAPGASPSRPLATKPYNAPVARPSRPRAVSAPNDRGPMGRRSATQLPSSEEFEDRTSLEDGGSIEGPGRLNDLDESRRRRVVVDQDEGAEATIRRRLQETEARTRSFSESDHRSFHQKLKDSEAVQPVESVRLTAAQLRQAFVWREILGPPKALE